MTGDGKQPLASSVSTSLRGTFRLSQVLHTKYLHLRQRKTKYQLTAIAKSLSSGGTHVPNTNTTSENRVSRFCGLPLRVMSNSKQFLRLVVRKKVRGNDSRKFAVVLVSFTVGVHGTHVNVFPPCLVLLVRNTRYDARRVPRPKKSPRRSSNKVKQQNQL